jgi:hypothetical protein
MALDISVAASAQCLQARNDRYSDYLRQERAQEATAAAREQERVREARLRVEAIDREIEQARNARADVEAGDRRAANFERLALAAQDESIDQAFLRRRDDISAAAEEAAFQRRDAEALIQRDIDLQATRNDRPLIAEQPPAGVGFDAYLSARDNRVAERAAQDAQQAFASERDFNRSASSVSAIRNDPALIPDEQVRGGIVDFSA